VTEAATEGWHAVGGMDTRTRMFPGGHFFFLTARDAVTSHLIGDLTGALDAPTAAAAGEILR
jgi:surfactin synthase thioesterase subunit